MRGCGVWNKEGRRRDMGRRGGKREVGYKCSEGRRNMMGRKRDVGCALERKGRGTENIKERKKGGRIYKEKRIKTMKGGRIKEVGYRKERKQKVGRVWERSERKGRELRTSPFQEGERGEASG